jgi:peroxiredoxin
MLKIIKLLAICLFTLTSAASSANAPDLSLVDLDGKQRHVNEYIGKGQWTVVVIWAEDCEVCNAEIQSYDFFHDEHKNKNARVLGVTVDGKEKIALSRDFVKRHGLTFPNLLIEPDMKEIGKFGGGNFVGTPTIYIYSPEGQIVAAQPGAVPISIIEDFINKQEAEKTASADK